MPLFIERLPFHCWIDATRSPPLPNWTIVLPVVLTEDSLLKPPPTGLMQEWVLDTGNRGEAFAWRQHVLQAGLDPDQNRRARSMRIRSVGGSIFAPLRKADIWLVSNLPGQPLEPYRVPLDRGLPFRDTAQQPDPHFDRPLIGIRALRRAGLRIEIDFAHDTVSVWTPDPPAP
ncbi:MAG: hypothetical protein L0Y71_04275 [Gemmataceae bacterium]|nr:hypothetical protein [Gemmataceae bacterium]